MPSNALFPTYIYQAPILKQGIKPLNQTLCEEAYQIMNYDIEGQDWSKHAYPGGYTSYSSIDNLHQLSSSFARLERDIFKHVQQYLKTLQYDLHSNQLHISDCWLNIMPAGVTHSQHIHPLSLISGTYYVQVPQHAASIKFEDPRLSKMMACPPKKDKANLKNKNHVSVQCKAGDLILFESWLRHEVPASQNKQDRISISFNYAWS